MTYTKKQKQDHSQEQKQPIEADTQMTQMFK